MDFQCVRPRDLANVRSSAVPLGSLAADRSHNPSAKAAESLLPSPGLTSVTLLPVATSLSCSSLLSRSHSGSQNSPIFLPSSTSTACCELDRPFQALRLMNM